MYMREIVRIVPLFIAALISINFLVSEGKSQIVKDNIPTITICQLNTTPNQYNGKTVRISAMYAANFEGSALVDESCKFAEKSIEFTANCKQEGDSSFFSKYKEDCKSFYKPLEKDIKGDLLDGMFVNVTVVGVVEVRNVRKNENLHNVNLIIMAIEKTSPIK